MNRYPIRPQSNGLIRACILGAVFGYLLALAI
jgi:hypothetical protein